MKWGLVPHWSKFEDSSLNTANARAENLAEGGGMWASLRGSKRCVIPVQGYYEWLAKDKQKFPYFTKRKDGNVMLLAGLYDGATIEAQDRTLWTFTIVTTAANNDFSWLHDRQPVILSSTSAVLSWLDTSSRSWSQQLTQLIQPYSDKTVELECYQVLQQVGKVGTESEKLIEPIANRKDGIQAMFTKQKEGKGKRTRMEDEDVKSQDPNSSPSNKSKYGVWDKGKSPKPETTPSKAKPESTQSQDINRFPSPAKKKASPQRPTNVKPITAFFPKRA
ncbi:hypothetical protein Ac2012v2_006122 [Leucoagaricus gongylophorus]